MKTTHTESVAAAFQILYAVAEGIREAGSMPAGHLYAVLLDRMTLETFERIIRVLVDADMVERTAEHVLKWKTQNS